MNEHSRISTIPNFFVKLGKLGILINLSCTSTFETSIMLLFVCCECALQNWGNFCGKPREIGLLELCKHNMEIWKSQSTSCR